jgi:F0F1-type ATP synthase assembly protein I
MVFAMSGDGNIPGKPKGALGDLVKAETMIQLALALPIGCVVGWLLGSLVDHHYGTRYGGIIGIVIGAVGGFIKIFQTAQKYMKDNN